MPDSSSHNLNHHSTKRHGRKADGHGHRISMRHPSLVILAGFTMCFMVYRQFLAGNNSTKDLVNMRELIGQVIEAEEADAEFLGEPQPAHQESGSSGTSGSGATGTATASKKKLNVIIFYPDDWSGKDVGNIDPYHILKTPTFDQLAAEGIHFLYNAVTTSICWISRATLFTGQYVSGHQSSYLFRPTFATNKDRWAKTWPALLQKAGYYVGHIGKWQYQDKSGYKDHHFNYSKYFEGWIKDQGRKDKHPTYIVELARDTALDFLKTRPKDKPFAATVAFYPPKGVSLLSLTKPEFAKLYENVTHPERYDRATAYTRLPPFLQNNATEARERYLWRFETDGTYQETAKSQCATLSHIDSVVGEMIQEIKDQGEYDNTLIIITADNGEFNGAHALADKWYPYQESIQVPLIIKDPRIPPSKRGTQNEDFTLNIDLAETILGAAGIEPPSTMHGRDIADLYLDRPNNAEEIPWRKEFYYEFPSIQGDIPASIALVRKDYKYINWWDHGHEELFDLKKDPVELHNLANKTEFATLKAEMKLRLDELRHDIFWKDGMLPRTSCDGMWPAGTTFTKDNQPPDCSPALPDRCCSDKNKHKEGEPW